MVYGIPESPKNTNRQLRIKKDMENAIEALLKTDNEIQSADIKDLYRLGKYDPENERPRPLLLKLLRSNMVFDILSSKTKLEAPIYIKPDMTYQERQKERVLLKERRSLIDQGMNGGTSKSEMILFLSATNSIAKLVQMVLN